MLRQVFLSVIVLVLSVVTASAATLWRFKGMTMSQFMLETLITPNDFFDTGNHRVFIADKRAPDPRFGCSMQLVTEHTGKGGTADNWTIIQIRYSGGCDFI